MDKKINDTANRIKQKHYVDTLTDITPDYEKYLGAMLDELAEVTNKYTQNGLLHVSSVISALDITKQKLENMVLVAMQQQQLKKKRSGIQVFKGNIPK